RAASGGSIECLSHSSRPARSEGLTRRVNVLRELTASGRIAPDWADALEPVAGQLDELDGALRAEREHGHQVLPAPDRVLKAFERPLAEVRVLIVGQDPYPTPGHPIGLAFAAAPDVRP